jgi:transcriptional regulator with XRE-family HTH domain
MSDELVLDKSVLEKIKQLRKKKRLTQKDIADELGISQSYFTKIEKGDHPLKLWMIERISKMLEITIGRLLESSTSNVVFNTSPIDIQDLEQKDWFQDFKNSINNQSSEEKEEGIEGLKKQIDLLQTSTKLYQVQIKQLYEIQNGNHRILHQVFAHNDILRNYLQKHYDQIKDLNLDDLKKVDPLITNEHYEEFSRNRKNMAETLTLDFEDYKDSLIQFDNIFKKQNDHHANQQE